MWNVAYMIIFALLGLGILIVIHEFGHFLVAKKTGVGVLTFSIGFGPKLWARRVGETEYAISAFPLGGYVKMIGEEPGEEIQTADTRRSFAHQGLLKRSAIVAAGPVFNLLLAVALFAWIFISLGVAVLTTRLASVEDGSPAAAAGLREGDVIIGVDGTEVRSWDELSQRIKQGAGKPLDLRVRRDQEEIEARVQPTRRKTRNLFGEEIEIWAIGISSDVRLEKGNPWLAVGQAFYKTGEFSVVTLLGLYKMIKGDISPRNLGGPLLIAQKAGEQAREGVSAYLFFIAILSVNLGVLNLLPIPVLDGGHLLFFLLEGILRRPVELKYRERAQQVGVFVLILVMIYAFYNDLTRFFD